MPPKGAKATAGRKAAPPARQAGKSSQPASRGPSTSQSAATATQSVEPPVTPVRRPQIFAPSWRQHLVNQSSSGEEFETPERSDLDDDDEPSAPLPPAYAITMGSPVKRARVIADANLALYKKPDLEVWNTADEKLIDSALSIWRSSIYSHYTISIRRNVGEDGTPISMDYCFTCKDHPENHSGPKFRPRERTDLGTKNLKTDVEKCEKAQGIYAPPSSPTLEYSSATHRALIALRCAKDSRPINTIIDDEYQQEVQMLRPGAGIPHSTTVREDILHIYNDLSIFVLNYFINLNCMVHLVLDGWTAPIVASYLGLVVVWYANGTINRAVLELIRLTKSHTGQYLAEVTAECIKRYGLAEKLLGLCMDNASNCNRLASVLPQFIPGFHGDNSRLRCIAHIINLVAKIFISFFFKKPKRNRSNTETHSQEAASVDDLETAVLEEAELDAQVEQDDDGQIAHDEPTVKTIRDEAIELMEEIGVEMTTEEEEVALNVFPKVAGLARRVHDNSTLCAQFDKCIDADTELQSTKRALDRRVPTRWNADFDCLAAHLHFKSVIQSMTGVSDNKLKAYRLTEEQWELAEDVEEVLKLFKDITLVFSQAEIPLVVDALPILYQLRESMELVVLDQPAIHCTDSDSDSGSDASSTSSQTTRQTPSVLRIAAKAAVLLLNKYLDLMWDCDIYPIAIVMCPDWKLQWFKDHKFSSDHIKKIKATVVKMWKEKYGPKPEDVPKEKEKSTGKRPSKWAAPDNTKKKKHPYDHIETFLSEPVTTREAIDTLPGGYLEYWEAALVSWPMVARMALDFISAPATSVDAKRAFSTGHRQINYLQHNMTSKTFQARMAIGSWIKTPLFPGLEATADIILKYMKSGPPK